MLNAEPKGDAKRPRGKRATIAGQQTSNSAASDDTKPPQHGYGPTHDTYGAGWSG